MWVYADEVRDRWIGADHEVPDSAVDVLIGDAEDAIRSAVPGIDALVEVSIPLSRVKRVVARMVIRVLRNPSGIRTMQETTGQFSGSTTYAGDSPGEIVFTDDDRRDLLGKGASGRRAFSVMPGGVT